MSRTITKLFDTYSDAASAVNALEQLGVPHSDVSIVANNAHGEHGVGHDGVGHDRDGHDGVGDVNDHGDVSRGVSTGAALGGVGGLLAGLGLLAIPGLGPIVAAGWLASTVVGAGIGAAGGAASGGIVGALKNAGHTDEEANVYAEGVRRGGALVSAKVDDALASDAESVLNGHNPVDATARGSAYRQEGWSAFDADAPAYERNQVDAERSRYNTSTL